MNSVNPGLYSGSMRGRVSYLFCPSFFLSRREMNRLQHALNGNGRPRETEEQVLAKWAEIRLWIQQNARWPRKGATDPVQRTHAIWIQNHTGKKGKSAGFHPGGDGCSPDQSTDGGASTLAASSARCPLPETRPTGSRGSPQADAGEPRTGGGHAAAPERKRGRKSSAPFWPRAEPGLLPPLGVRTGPCPARPLPGPDLVRLPVHAGP